MKIRFKGKLSPEEPVVRKYVAVILLLKALASVSQTKFQSPVDEIFFC